MRLLVTRPEPDAAETAARLMGLGHAVIVRPMLTVVFNPPPVVAEASALVFTSRNGVRAVANWPQAPGWRALPAFAVGGETAAAARSAGFADVLVAEGDAAALVELVAKEFGRDAGPVLYPAPRDQAADLAGRLAARGFSVLRIEAYRTEPADGLGDELTRALRDGTLDGALLFSRRTAATFANLVKAAGLDEPAARLTLYALSPNAAEPLRSLGSDVRVAARPDAESLLALLGQPG